MWMERIALTDREGGERAIYLVAELASALATYSSKITKANRLLPGEEVVLD